MAKEVKLRQGWVDAADALSGETLALGSLSLTTPLPVSSGGTGQATEAEALGEMTQALTEDTAPDRQLDMVAGQDASADTAKKVAYYNVAGSAVLASGTVTNAAALDLPLDGYTQFKLFKLHIINAVPATDGVEAYIRFSDDGGATFEADANDYAWAILYNGEDAVTGSSTASDNGDTAITLTEEVGNASGERLDVEFTIHDPAAAAKTRCHWIGSAVDVGGASYATSGSGGTTAAAASTDVRFLFSSGDIASAKYTLIGYI